MKNTLITIFLLLTFSANSVLGAGMICEQTDMSDHSMHMSMSMDGEMVHEMPLDIEQSVADACPDCGEIACGSAPGGCGSCIAHCVSAVATGPFNLAPFFSSDMDTPFVSGQLPAVYFSFLRPPKQV